MHFVYPKDKATWSLELQYFYGPGLLVAPVTQEGATSVDVYLPKDTFYDWYTQKAICGKGANYKFTNQNITSIPLLIRSGVILPVRTSSANTTTAVRKQDFELIVPLRADGTAKGELYLDDGETIDGTYSLINFSYKDGKLTVEGSFDYKVPVVVSKVTVLGSGGDACGSGNSGVSSEPKVTKVQISLSKPGVFDAQPKQLFLYSTRPGDREE
jgi:alpha-glucosidase